MAKMKRPFSDLTPIELAERAASIAAMAETFTADTETKARLLANSRYCYGIAKGLTEASARAIALETYATEGGKHPEDARNAEQAAAQLD